MTTIVAFLLTAIYFFCNGAMVVIVDQKREKEDGETTKFYEEWEREVEECNQHGKVGKFLMKGFYFIPSITSICQKRFQKN